MSLMTGVLCCVAVALLVPVYVLAVPWLRPHPRQKSRKRSGESSV